MQARTLLSLGMPAAFLGLAGCAPALSGAIYADNTVLVEATAETEPVGTMDQDAADDPAIWRNPSDPERSLIVGTDKKAGIYLYGMDGRTRHFLADGQLNNVDLVDLGASGIIVVASDRNDEAQARIRLYRLNPEHEQLVPLGLLSVAPGEGYGICLNVVEGGKLDAFSVLKNGIIHQVRIDLTGTAPSGVIVRSLRLASQAEGCVVDSRTDTLYVGEEAVGVWAFSSLANGATKGRLVAPVDQRYLRPDVEGLALAQDEQDGGYLVVSSQGDNAFALYRLPAIEPVGSFHIGGGQLPSVEETDGIALVVGSFGKHYPQGLLVVQDGINSPQAQNFKLVSWAKVLAAFAIKDTSK